MKLPVRFDEAAKGLPELVRMLRAALDPKATSSGQQQTFQFGCAALGNLIARIEADPHGLREFEGAVKGFQVSVKNDRQSFDSFIDQEKLALQRHLVALSDEDLREVETSLRSLELKDLEFSVEELVNELKFVRDIFCALASEEISVSIPKELLAELKASAVDICVITGDMAAAGAAVTAGPFAFVAAALLAVGSVGHGVRSIKSRHETLGRLKKAFLDSQEQSRIAAANRAAAKRNAPPPKKS